MKNTIHFETLGCKLNQAETEGAARAFSDAGFSVSMDPLTAADDVQDDVLLCVVNTCTVTAKAEQKARRIIRLLLAKCPACAVLVTGCYAQLNRKEILEIDSRICVLGGQNKGALADVPALLQELQKRSLSGEDLSVALQQYFDAPDAQQVPQFRLTTDRFLNHSRASIKIQDGCNAVCTYCRIRLARGKSVSLAAQDVIDQVLAMERAGQNEVVITTVNIAQYHGAWKDGFVDFAGLLELLLASTQKIGIRISSLYPEIVTERLAKIIENPRVRPHFHISIQSGSDTVLAKMKRPYRIAVVFKAVELLRRAKKSPFLACDIIAGFPGETDEDFALTMDMLKKTGMTFVHAFPFSARPGTEAYSMRPMVPNAIAGKRIAELEAYNRTAKTAYINSFVGCELQAVCETVHRAKFSKDRVIVHAVTENFLHCQLVFSLADTHIPAAGSVVTVRVRRPLTDAEKTGESDTFAELV
ncbi:MAG: tRNA (N(6)-L-threonylcarbamoyladenosine(37)-C(2))-methylthiotransferase MtaB [Treponema sp.]|nr:tRNA (N(6)-L-threonylcarbamoyladenosine(37)-C(2))-methylthiotransferase MtaB [Treponema sp.]